MAFAHSVNEAGRRHDLAEHLTTVAAMAREYAAAFGLAELAEWAGYWHDLGKYHPDFQAYLLAAEQGRKQRGPDHKGAGATVAMQHCQALAPIIRGHHGGLDDVSDTKAWLVERKADPRTAEALTRARTAGARVDPPAKLPPLPPGLTQHDAEFLVRFVFSALVDADCLDTERHFEESKAEQRGSDVALAALWERIEQNQAGLAALPQTPVNGLRNEVYRACREAATLPPGFFRLTVPTGGGKTLSGLAFAVRHALNHDLRRVVVAIPYTSITEQTADTYRQVVGDDRAVLEHHSAARHAEEPEGTPTVDWQRLAAENWDAPLVVTTTVQLFDSLLGNRTSTCRKLHRLARSVVILDEAQTLPSGKLEPILDVLRTLVKHAGASVVLCTATQPALASDSGFRGLDNVRDIIPDPTPLFAALRRVRYQLPPTGTQWSWAEVATAMRQVRQTLAVVNTKQDALTLLDTLGDDETLHLSTNLCGAHRRAVLETIKARLNADEPCRVVSTQVIEAGVDVDFPLVLRAMGPLDRIVQAAGRCNREGRLEFGSVIVFDPADGHLPPGDYRTATDTTRIFLQREGVDMDDPAQITDYFRRLFANVDLDAKKIQALRHEFKYASVAKEARIIDDETVPVVVQYAPKVAEIQELLAELRHRKGGTRQLMRRMQPYTVGIAHWNVNRLQRDALLAEVVPGLYQWLGRYDPRRGITVGAADPGGHVW